MPKPSIPESASASAESSRRKGKKPSGTASRPVRYRTVSHSETDLPDHVKKLKETLQLFPVFDLLSRKDFSEEEQKEKQKISGRALKKVVQLDRDKNPYLLKKNAREAEREKDGQKTPSSEMDLDENHTETFREICALRLFQIIWQEPDKPLASTADAKVVLSSFSGKKPDNIIKKQWTKAYFASQQVDNLPFNTMRLAVENLKKLEQKNDDGTFKNQHLIDQLCEQIIIQCILSNPDAIKFDNFFVDDEKEVVVQFDFGDARKDEEYSPDPLCILDAIRKHIDGSPTKSIKELFTEENFVYAQAIKFFHKNITPNHLLNVIDKLSRVPEKVLWQICYIYSYGYEPEKRNYADCFVARVRNFIALKNVLQKHVESDKVFSSKPIRNIVAESDEYRDSKKDLEICLDIKKFLIKAKEIFDLLLVEKEKLDEALDYKQQQSSEEKDDYIYFETEECESSHQSQSENSESASASEVDESESEIEKSTESVSSESVSETEESESETESEFEPEESESEIVDEDIDEITKKLKEMKNIRDKVGETFKQMSDEMLLNLLNTQSESKDEISALKNLLTNFYNVIKQYAVQDYELPSKEAFEEYYSVQSELVNSTLFAFLTHYNSYDSLKQVKEQAYTLDKKTGKEIIERLEKIKVRTDINPSDNLRPVLERILSTENPQSVQRQ